MQQHGHTGTMIIANGTANTTFQIAAMNILVELNRAEERTMMNWISGLKLNNAENVFLQ